MIANMEAGTWPVNRSCLGGQDEATNYIGRSTAVKHAAAFLLKLDAAEDKLENLKKAYPNYEALRRGTRPLRRIRGGGR
jgi:hypothetical protein